MNNCGLCQKFHNNLIQIYNKRIKSLAQIILKLKGYKDALDNNKALMICEKCKQGIENVATFWESIPEAKKEQTIETTVSEQEIEKLNSVMETKPETDDTNLPAVTLVSPEQSSIEQETYHAPIKLRIKLPQKRKRRVKANTSNNLKLNTFNIEGELQTKRIRRPPKRFEDFNTSNNLLKTITEPNFSETINETSLENFPQVASLRLTNGDTVAKLVEIESSGVSSRMRILCQFCPKVFHFEKEFQKHFKQHPDTNQAKEPNAEALQNYLFYCNLCDKAFREHYAVRRHYRFAHSQERPLKCDHCEASFKYKFNLDYHMSKHIPKKRFECVYCKKMFVLRYELRIHLRTHTNEKPYKCQFCSFAFAHQTNLKNHEKVKHFKDLTNQSALKDDVINDTNEMCYESSKEIHFESTVIQGIDNEPVVLGQKDSEINLSLDLGDCSSDLKDINTEMYTTEHGQLPEDIAKSEDHFGSTVMQRNDMLPVLEDHRDRDLNVSPVLDDFSSDSKDTNTEIFTTEPEQFPEDTTEPETNQSNKNVDKFKASVETNDSADNVDVRFKDLPKYATLHMDNSILKALATSELLELKKWPKHFQNTAATNQNHVTTPVKETINSTLVEIDKLNPYKEEKTNESCSESIVNELLEIAKEHGAQCLELEHTAKKLELIKYKRLPLEDCNNTLSNSTGISSLTLNNTKSSISESLLKLNALKAENAELLNFQVPSGSTLTKGGKFINITKLSEQNSSLLKSQHKTVDNHCKTFKETRNIGSIKDKSFNSDDKTNSLAWKVIKVSSRPVKVKNICNLNNLIHKNSSILNTNLSNTKQTKVHLKTTQQKETKAEYSAMSLDCKKPALKSPHFSTQSLLKPVTKSQQLTALSATNPGKYTITPLANKPLITKIEILPPLNTLPITSTCKLLKLPSDYKYQCPHCWKYFKHKSPLNKHLRTHTGEKPYKCNLCPKSYADASNYKKHKMLHKNAAEALNISRTNAYAVHNSPAYSTVSDPDPDGIEVMQTIKKFDCSSAEDNEDDDDVCLSSSTMESCMWQDALEHALKNEEIVENIKKNLAGLNNAIMPKSGQQQLVNTTQTNVRDINKIFSSEDPD